MNFISYIQEYFHVIGTQYSELPVSLSGREPKLSILALAAVGVSALLIAIANLASRHLFFNLTVAFARYKQRDKMVQVEYPLLSLSSLVLTINYLIVLSGLLYMAFGTIFSLPAISFLYFMIIPFVMMIIPYFSSVFTGILTGEPGLMSENKINIFVFSQFKGIYYSLLLLVWIFNMHWTEIFIYIFIGSELLFTIYRFLRGFQFANKKGAAWYYIILYFCTLEILPFIILYQILNSKMDGKFNWLLN